MCCGFDVTATSGLGGAMWRGAIGSGWSMWGGVIGSVWSMWGGAIGTESSVFHYYCIENILFVHIFQLKIRTIIILTENRLRKY